MEYLKWSYSGIDLDLEGTGGPECLNFLPRWQRYIETFVIVSLAVFQFIYCWPRLRLALPNDDVRRENGTNHKVETVCARHHEWTTRRVLLLIHTLTFGIELGFKLASRSMLWILNPCHIVTIVQLYILCAPPSPLVTAIFRMHLHMLNGPVIAIVFPVLNTRTLPLEQVTYYVQHILIVVIPFFLLRHGGLFSVEEFSDMSWAVTSLAVQTLYHFLVLQTVGLLTMVNLDNMLCPAISDPFHGRWYRVFAVGHQTALILIFGKIVTFVFRHLSLLLNRLCPPRELPTPSPACFSELSLSSNLGRLLESIPEPGSDQTLLVEINGRVKAH